MSRKKSADPPEELVAIGEVKPHPQNYQSHPDDQVGHLAASIEEHGLYKNVVLAKDGTLLAGHGVVEGAKKAGRSEVPARRMPYGPEDPRALKILAGDNEVGRRAGRDDEALAAVLSQVAEAGDLAGTGFDDGALEELLASLADPDPPDEFPEVDESLPTEHECPKCGYKWSGSTAPGE